MKLLLSFATFLIILISCNKKIEDVQTDPQFKIDSLDLYFGPEAGKIDSFTVFTDLQWSVSITPSTATWLQLNVTGGTGQRKIVATTLENNPSDSSRTATITVTPLGSTSAKPIVIKATQYGKTFVPSLKVDRTSITLDGRWNSIDSFTIESNINWMIPDTAGFVFKPNAGTGTTKVYVTPHVANYSRNGAYTKSVKIIPLGSTTLQSPVISITQTELSVIKDWSKTFGSGSYEEFKSIAKCSDGGYVMAGSQLVGNVYGCYVVKISGNGDLLWEKFLGSDQFLQQDGNIIMQTSDGGFIISGVRVVVPSSKYLWITKLDPQGNTVWEKTSLINAEALLTITDMITTNDGGYILTGNIFNQMEDVALVARIDGNGNMLWNKIYSQKGFTKANAIKATVDGGYIFVGAQGNKALVTKIDGSGSILWDRALDSSIINANPILGFTDIIETKDGNFLLGGYFDINTSQFEQPENMLVKIDNQGKFLWIRSFIINPHYNLIKSIIPSSNGGFLLVSDALSKDGFTLRNYNARISKITDEGEYAWSLQVGGSSPDALKWVVEGPGNSYIAVGVSESWDGDLSNTGAKRKAWVFKLHEQY